MGQIAGHTPPDSRPGREIARTLAETAARRRAVVIAGHSGDLDVARDALGDDAPEVRASALHALQRLGGLTRAALVAATGDPDASVRRTAAEIVATWRDPDGSDEPFDLLRLLRDDDPTVVEVAAWACGESGCGESGCGEAGRGEPGRGDLDPGPTGHPDSVIRELVQLVTTHDDALVREAAVAALGAIGDERGLAAILAATADKATVRRRAVIALAPFDGDEVEAALRRALDDRDWQVRQAAEDLLE